MEKINKLLLEQIGIIKPSDETIKKIEKIANDFCKDLKKKLKDKKIKADVFIGGSLAKNTLIKKEKYDIDIFVRFDKKYLQADISDILGKILGKKAKKIHGSRDYYQIIVDKIILEIVPVIKIKEPKNAQNITDLSYFHVNYVLKKIKRNKKIANEILLAKTFAHAHDCYGAESYIKGFSGYSLELLICHYGNFLNFIKNTAESKEEKIIIDDEKFYKNKEKVLRDLNGAKIQSPIILVDPTYKERNALAGLSYETFKKFKESCKNFLKKPGACFFLKKNIGQELKKKYDNRLNIVVVKTNKQKGDIAGTKSKKFFNFFVPILKKEFEIQENFFDYDEKNNRAYFYFVLKNKKEDLIKGPHVTKVNNLTAFKKKHPEAFIKEHFAYAKAEHNLSFKEFLKVFLRKYKQIVDQMGIKSIEIVS